jgi:hypothetical protein
MTNNNTSTTDLKSEQTSFIDLRRFNSLVVQLTEDGRIAYQDFVNYDMRDLGFNPNKPEDFPFYQKFRRKIDDLHNFNVSSREEAEELHREVSTDLKKIHHTRDKKGLH